MLCDGNNESGVGTNVELCRNLIDMVVEVSSAINANMRLCNICIGN